jgi:D-beta-D-heptose 7-phosphate kinase/D-beta-D-heptose 1-phosphate adenosyltransferase
MSSERLRHVIERMAQGSTVRVLVVGDVMVDRYWRGPAGRVSPEAPVVVVRIEGQEPRAGGAANVACNVVGLRAQACLMGVVGEDEAAQELQSLLEAQGVESRLHPVPGARTITKLRVIARQQQLIRLDFESDFYSVDRSALRADFEQRVRDCDVVVLSDYAKGTLADIRQLIAAANACGKPIIVDPKGVDFERYRGATLITPNLSEFEAVAGPCRDLTDLHDKARALSLAVGIQAILVTRGEHGMSLVTSHAAPLDLPALAREVFDVTGAGDTVVATLAVALGMGERLETAMTLANHAASVVVGKLGTDTVTPAELLRSFADGEVAPSRGVLSEDAVWEAIQIARRRGERIVMTNGCFDLLHPGHLSYLAAAKALGDRLVVAVNDDGSVTRLKGPERPVNPLSHRMAMLAALEVVDWVLPFSEDTPARVIQKLLPDVLVKGGDYTPDAVVGGDSVIAAGGEVKILPFIEGQSSTRMIERIRGQST